MEFLGLWLIVEVFVFICKAIGFVAGLIFRILFFWLPSSPPESDSITIWIDD